jgi:tRNA (mo5U34)-methyltransferase
MAMRLDIELTEGQKAAMAAIPATSWFTHFIYRNAESPSHPNAKLTDNNEMKQALIGDWLVESVKGKRVLDLFSANGAFAIMAAMAGAKVVVGVEYSEERIKCAEFVASTVRSNCKIEFKRGDVYSVNDYFDAPFDVVLCLGGLYHVADPALVLRQIGRLTKERLILQTSHVMPARGNVARFIVRREDETKRGMTSIRGGYGRWYYSPGCLRELLLHGGFDVIKERQPPKLKRRRFPWYAAYCSPL